MVALHLSSSADPCFPRTSQAKPSSSKQFHFPSLPFWLHSLARRSKSNPILGSSEMLLAIPFAIPSMLFHRRAVLRSPRFAGVPFPRYADQCFSASWWRNSIPTRICAVLFRRFAVRSKLILRKSNLFNAPGVSTRLGTIPVLINADNSGSTLRCYVATLFRSIATHLFAGPILRVSRPFDQSKAVSGRLDSIQFRCWSLTCYSSPVLGCAVTLRLSRLCSGPLPCGASACFSNPVRCTRCLSSAQSMLFRCGYSSTNSTLQFGVTNPPTTL